MEKEKERERVLVPVRRREKEQEQEMAREIPEGETLAVPEIPRRWRIY